MSRTVGGPLAGRTTNPQRREGMVAIESLFDFDDIIDTRSPAEYAEDHAPGAINLPVLDNAERARIGTLHNSPPPSTPRRLARPWSRATSPGIWKAISPTKPAPTAR